MRQCAGVGHGAVHRRLGTVGYVAPEVVDTSSPAALKALRVRHCCHCSDCKHVLLLRKSWIRELKPEAYSSGLVASGVAMAGFRSAEQRFGPTGWSDLSCVSL